MFRLAGALLAGLVTGLPALAQVRAGGEFRVNSATTGTQRTPAVAMGADGGFLVVWTVPDDGSSLGLGGQAFAADGRPLGAEFQVNAFTSGIQLRPAVAASPRGGFVVAWQSEGQDGSGFAAVAALFDGQGRRRGAEFVLNSITTGQQFGPRIGVDAAGRFVAVWSEDGRDGSLSGIVGRRFDAAGSPLGAEFVVNTWTLHLQIGPVVAVAPDGRFVVSWDSYEQDGDDWGVFAQRYSPSAARLGFEFRVNSTVTGPQFGYGVAGDAAGGFVVTWVSPDGQDGDRAGVFAQRYTPSGVRSGSEFQVNVFSQGNQRRASAGSDAAGNFVVAWQADYQDGYWIGITGARFDREGLRREPEFVVNTYTTSFQTYAAAASDASGNVVVVWESVTPAAEIDVFAQRFGGLHAQALALDTAAGPASDGNRVLEPGESVDVRPSWVNRNGGTLAFASRARELSGPAGATYTLADDAADYGAVGNGDTAACGDCLAAGVSNPAVRPATHWDAMLLEQITPDGLGQVQPWRLHVGASFNDVPRANPAYRFVETMLHRGITGGCGGSEYCPLAAATREQMAVFVLLAAEGGGYLPPACGTPAFADVPASSPYCRYVEELARRGVVSGCAPGLFCPGQAVTREQMPVFVLRTKEPAFVPPACTAPLFTDVPAGSPFCRWIEELARRGVVAGCGGGSYCPGAAVTREQMAVFLAAGFGLTLYGV